MNVTTTKRVVIVVGSLIVLGFVNALASEYLRPLAPVIDAGAGYAFGIITRHYW